MKQITIYLLSILFMLFTGCSEDSNNSNPTGLILGGGGTGGGSVTIAISITTGQQGEVTFNATPSVNVKITKVTVSLPAQQLSNEFTDDGSTVYNANQVVPIDTYTGVATGQEWTFQFEGTLASNNQTFNVTSNYTIP